MVHFKNVPQFEVVKWKNHLDMRFNKKAMTKNFFGVRSYYTQGTTSASITVTKAPGRRGINLSVCSDSILLHERGMERRT